MGTEASFAKTLARLGVAAGPPPVMRSPNPARAAVEAPLGARSRAHHGERDAGDGKGERTERPGPERPELESSDPTWTHRAALMGPPPGDLQTEARTHVEQVTRHASLEELAPTLLRKMAWSGDGRKGAARLELGAGSLAGAVVTLEADQGVVALSVDGLNAAEESSLRARLAAGLEARGFRLAP